MALEMFEQLDQILPLHTLFLYLLLPSDLTFFLMLLDDSLQFPLSMSLLLLSDSPSSPENHHTSFTYLFLKWTHEAKLV